MNRKWLAVALEALVALFVTVLPFFSLTVAALVMLALLLLAFGLIAAGIILLILDRLKSPPPPPSGHLSRKGISP